MIVCDWATVATNEWYNRGQDHLHGYKLASLSESQQSLFLYKSKEIDLERGGSPKYILFNRRHIIMADVVMTL